MLGGCADVQIYRHVKGAMDSLYGVVSQCIVSSKASGLGRAGDATSERNILQYQANVGLKVYTAPLACARLATVQFLCVRSTTDLLCWGESSTTSSCVDQIRPCHCH